MHKMAITSLIVERVSLGITQQGGRPCYAYLSPRTKMQAFSTCSAVVLLALFYYAPTIRKKIADNLKVRVNAHHNLKVLTWFDS